MRVLEHGLRCYDLDLGQAWAVQNVAAARPVTGLDPGGTARLVLRVLAEAAREDAKREQVAYDDGLKAAVKTYGTTTLAAAETHPRARRSSATCQSWRSVSRLMTEAICRSRCQPATACTFPLRR